MRQGINRLSPKPAAQPLIPLSKSKNALTSKLRPNASTVPISKTLKKVSTMIALVETQFMRSILFCLKKILNFLMKRCRKCQIIKLS